MAWTTPRNWVAGELVTAALFNLHIRDNENAIQDGLVGVGFDAIDYLGASSDPAVSAASHAVVVYNSSTNQLRASLNGGAYAPLGGGPTSDLQDWLFMSGGL